MVQLEALTPYPIDGETTKLVAPGDTAIWKFTTWKHEKAPDRKAAPVCMVSNYPYYDDNWPDPTRDYKSPKFFLDGEEFPQHGDFMFTGTHELEVHITLTKKAQPQGRPFIVQLNVWPKLD